MKIYYILLAVFLIAACNESRPVKTCDTYAEAADPHVDATADWTKVTENFHAAFGNIDVRYPKSSIPAGELTSSWKGSGWRGERVSSQVVLWSAHPVEQVECEFSPFRSTTGASMDPSIATARFVRYVLTDIIGPGCGYRKPEDFPVSLVPDGLDPVSCFNMEAQTTRPVWLSFDIPADVKPGIYTSTLSIYGRNQKTRKLEINLEVLNQTLPAPKDWVFHLDLWQHPSAVARVNNVGMWSEEHWQLMDAPMSLLADAGQKVITATLNKDPWNNQCYDRYDDMIRWTKKSNGDWQYDYSVFDRWVEKMMGLGITRMINCYSLLPWNNEIHYFDEKKGEQINVSAKPGSKDFIELWTPFLKDFRNHVEKKGWLGITNIAMDERSPEDMKAALGLLKNVVPDMTISLADNHKSYKQYPYMKDLCVAFGSLFDAPDLEYRKEHNLNSTYYVCCSDKFPNVFTCSEFPEATYIAWHAMGAGFDGFLRWAYNSWTENPLTDSRFRTWPAGDTYIIYPGGRSSIRFERLREGIQDAEKIRILRQQLDPEKLTKLNQEVARFGIPEKPAESYVDMLHQAKHLLEELSR